MKRNSDPGQIVDAGTCELVPDARGCGPQLAHRVTVQSADRRSCIQIAAPTSYVYGAYKNSTAGSQASFRGVRQRQTRRKPATQSFEAKAVTPRHASRAAASHYRG